MFVENFWAPAGPSLAASCQTNGPPNVDVTCTHVLQSCRLTWAAPPSVRPDIQVPRTMLVCSQSEIFLQSLMIFSQKRVLILGTKIWPRNGRRRNVTLSWGRVPKTGTTVVLKGRRRRMGFLRDCAVLSETLARGPRSTLSVHAATVDKQGVYKEACT